MKRHTENPVAVPRQSRHTSCRRVVEEVAAREGTHAQPHCIIVTNRAFAIETKQPSSKHCAQSPSGNQQQPVLRANTTSHRVRWISFKGAPVTTLENRHHTHGGDLKPVQERGARYEAADELRLCAAPLDERVFIHLLWEKAQGKCGWRGRFSLAAAAAPSCACVCAAQFKFATQFEPDFSNNNSTAASPSQAGLGPSGPHVQGVDQFYYWIPALL